MNFCVNVEQVSTVRTPVTVDYLLNSLISMTIDTSHDLSVSYDIPSLIGVITQAFILSQNRAMRHLQPFCVCCSKLYEALRTNHHAFYHSDVIMRGMDYSS